MSGKTVMVGRIMAVDAPALRSALDAAGIEFVLAAVSGGMAYAGVIDPSARGGGEQQVLCDADDAARARAIVNEINQEVAAAADAEWKRAHPRKPHFWNRRRDGGLSGG